MTAVFPGLRQAIGSENTSSTLLGPNRNPFPLTTSGKDYLNSEFGVGEGVVFMLYRPVTENPFRHSVQWMESVVTFNL